MSSRRGIFAFGGGAMVVLVMSGCVDLTEPGFPLSRGTALLPGGAGTALFYPLDLGNHWDYQHTFAFQVVPTGTPPEPPTVIQTTINADLSGTEERFGREYVVQVETHHQDSGDLQLRFLYRQDRGGLYNADAVSMAAADLEARKGDAQLVLARVLGNVPHAETSSAALHRLLEKQAALRKVALGGRASLALQAGNSGPGPLEGEIALLRYPLSSSKTWHAREDPLVVYTVEGKEVLGLPAGSFNGWRIRIEWPGVFGPNDRVHVWYGRDGFLRLEAHLEGVAIDENGNPIGTVVGDESQLLSGLSLVRVTASTP